MVDPFDVTSYDFEGGRIFALRGELDASCCQGLAELLVGPPGSLVVVDLDQLTFMDSSGLSAIHVARGMAIKDGGTLVVCRPTQIVRRVLEITGLDSWVADWDPHWSGGSAVRCAAQDTDPRASQPAERHTEGQEGPVGRLISER